MAFYHRLGAASVRACFCTHQSRRRLASVIKFACVFKFIISFLIMKLIASFSKYGLKLIDSSTNMVISNLYLCDVGLTCFLQCLCRQSLVNRLVDEQISQSFVSNLNNASKFSFLFYL